MKASRTIAFIAGLLAAAAARVAGAEPVVLRVDWTVLPQQFAPLIPLVPKYGPDVYRHYGKSYVVEPIRFQGGGVTLTALAVGETHLSTLNPQALVLGIVNAKLDLRVIAQQLSTETPGHLQTWFWVKKDRIRTVDDLKGKVVGISARASATDAGAEIVLARHGLTTPRDYHVLEVPFPSQLAALKAGIIDAAVLVPPFNQDAEADGSLKPLFSLGDAFGPLETSLWVAKTDFVAANRAALVDFLEDNQRMRRWMLDPRTRNDAIALLSDVTKVPAEKYSGWVYTSRDYYYDPRAMVDVERLQRNIDDMKKAQIVPATIDVSRYVDPSLAEEAAARIAVSPKR
jgi:NitT/TauT family transport system substrate-binding protein